MLSKQAWRIRCPVWYVPTGGRGRQAQPKREPTCSRDPPDKGDPVGTPSKGDAVLPKCEAGRSSTPHGKCVYDLVPKRVDHGTPRD